MAEQFDAKGPNKSTETVVTREGARDGAEIYAEPKKRGFPWWILLFGLIPLLLLWNRNNNTDRDRTPVAVVSSAPVSASPSSSDTASSGAVSDATTNSTGAAIGDDATSRTGSAALPPTNIAGKDMKVYSGTDITVAPKSGASKQGEPLSDVVTFSQVADKSTLVDRKVKLTNVNVVEVLSPRALIVGPSSGQHMLVLLDQRLDAGAGNQKVSVAEGKMVSLTGVIKQLPSPEVLTSEYSIASDKMTAHSDDSVYLHATIAQEK